MIRCKTCLRPLNERTDIRYCAGPVTLCSPPCVVQWRKSFKSW
jgi:hypothetical protein